jgi:starvation-inducible DNA-binding protein
MTRATKLLSPYTPAEKEMKMAKQTVRETTNSKNSKIPMTAKMTKKSAAPTTDKNSSEPVVSTRGPEIQRYNERFHVPNGLKDKACEQSIGALNQVLADTISIRDMYKKHHWQVSGATFYQLHLLLDAHYEVQAELTDTLAERIQALGGISVAMPQDVAELTKVERPPRGRETPNVQLSRLIDAHELILKESRIYADKAQDAGDAGTNDLLVSQIIRTNEKQIWFLSEHLVFITGATPTMKNLASLNS